MNKSGEFFIYRATPLRCHLESVFTNPKDALDSAKDISLIHKDHILSVVNSNGVCIGKYYQGKYYI